MTTHDALVQRLEDIAIDPGIDSRTRHTLLVQALAPLGEANAHAEAHALETHGWYIRTSPRADGHDVLLHAEAEVAAYRLEVAA